MYCKLPTNGKQLPAFPLEPVRGSNPGLRGGRRECYHSATVIPIKSQRGDEVDVQVKHKVHWPHEAILCVTARQRVMYDQLTLTQWVQGFCRNILEEKSGKRKDLMVAYLGDLMEDATDFTWQGAKAAHAVLLCEMERG